jgi:hypothetical protein
MRCSWRGSGRRPVVVFFVIRDQAITVVYRFRQAGLPACWERVVVRLGYRRVYRRRAATCIMSVVTRCSREEKTVVGDCAGAGIR